MPTIRNSYIQANNAGSFTLVWPSGTVAGDSVFLFVSGGWNISGAPTGWNELNRMDGSNFNGSVYTRIMTATDILIGHVTINMAGGDYAPIAVVTMVGEVGVRSTTASRNGSGSTSIALASDASVAVGDLVFLFGGNRAASDNTVDLGSVIEAINAPESGCLFGYSPAGAGSFTANFAYSSAGSGNYQAIVPVYDPTGTPTAVVNQDATVAVVDQAGGSARVAQYAYVAVCSEVPPVAGGAVVAQFAVVAALSPPPRRRGLLIA